MTCLTKAPSSGEAGKSGACCSGWIHVSKGKGGYPWESTPTMYTTMHLIYMAYIGPYEGISRKQLVGYSPKGTHIFPLNVGEPRP